LKKENRDRVKLWHNVYLHPEGEWNQDDTFTCDLTKPFTLRLHRTDVVKFYPNGDIELPNVWGSMLTFAWVNRMFECNRLNYRIASWRPGGNTIYCLRDRSQDRWHKYQSGLMFKDGVLTNGEPVRYQHTRLNTVETKPIRAKLRALKDTYWNFAVLHGRQDHPECPNEQIRQRAFGRFELPADPSVFDMEVYATLLSIGYTHYGRWALDNVDKAELLHKGIEGIFKAETASTPSKYFIVEKRSSY
jgi:hypothetical protein